MCVSYTTVVFLLTTLLEIVKALQSSGYWCAQCFRFRL